MSATEILRSLTVEPAAFLGVEVTGTGRVESGGVADLTVLDVESAPRPADLARIHAVIRDGSVMWSAG